jgi:hypothetical protein
MSNRANNLSLGVNLGWLQQGAAFGGRPINEMTADLERVRSQAGVCGYANFSGYVDVALTELNSGQPANSVLGEVTALTGLFQGQASGPEAAALSLGIVLGWLQQGARANNRLVRLATADLQAARMHAENAGYSDFHGYIDNALTELNIGQPVRSIMNEVTALIWLLQGQD